MSIKSQKIFKKIVRNHLTPPRPVAYTGGVQKHRPTLNQSGRSKEQKGDKMTRINYFCSECGNEVETPEGEVAFCPKHPTAIIDSVPVDSEFKINQGRLFFPKRPVNGFAGSAADQRAETLAKALNGVVVASDSDVQGIRPSYWVYRHFADVDAKDYDRITDDFTPEGDYSDYGFTEIELDGLGKVSARAVGADRSWRENICNAPFRCEIRRDNLSADLWVDGRDSNFWGYESNWYAIPEFERQKLIAATDGILDEYFSDLGLKRDEQSQTNLR